MPADTKTIQASVRQRKRLDRVFGGLGATLISLSLLVLLILLASLAKDGLGPLFQSTPVRADGESFGRREVLGTATLKDGQWHLDLGRLTVEGVPEAKLTPLLGKDVAVEGSLPRPPQKTVSADTVIALPTDGKSSGADVIGRLSKTADAYHIDPRPFRLDLSGEKATAVQGVLQDGEDVAVTGSRNASAGTIKVTDLTAIEHSTFFTSFPSRFAEEAGILSAWVGTLLIMLVTMLAAVPLGVAAGIYLEEYAPRNRLTSFIEINISNLAGVPSIIWGLMALSLLIYQFHFSRSVVTGGLTLGLLVLPIVIIATRESIRAVPGTIREASIGLGATKWQTVRYHVLPYSMSGILTGGIIALSRAIGETAPLITIGALTYIAFLPPSPVQATAPFVNFEWAKSPFTVLPIQLFNWVSRPDVKFHNNAAAAGVVLVALTLSLNSFAIYIRYRLRRGIKW